MDMDQKHDGGKSRLLAKLRNTFKFLFIRNNTLHDDTLLDKLATWLQLQLASDDEKCHDAISALEQVNWIQAVIEHSDHLNIAVLSFGLKILGQLSRSKRGQALLEVHATGLKQLLMNLSQNVDPDKASVRFALLHLLIQTSDKELSFVPSQESQVELARRGIHDNSIFVKRCAGDLLVRLFALPAFSQFPWQPVAIELLDLLTTVRPGHHASTATAQVALSVLQRFGSSGQLRSTYSALRRHMMSVVPIYIQKIDSVDFRIANYQLMIYLNTSFDGDSPPTDWVEFLNGLLETNHSYVGQTLLIETYKSLVKCDTVVPAWLKSATLRPLIVSSGWRPPPGQGHLTCDRLPKWQQRTDNFQIKDDDPLTAKMVFSILTNIAYLNSSFTDTNERVALLDLLLHYLSSRNPFIIVNLAVQEEKVVALQQKHQSAVLFAFTRLLGEWGDEWVGSLDAATQKNILENLCANLQNRAWTGWMATKALQLLKILLPQCSEHLEEMWESIGSQLQPAFVHWYFHVDWETTDAVLEVISVIAKLGQSHCVLQIWLEASPLIKLAFLALYSSNSYLNACALSVFGNMAKIPQHIGIGSDGIPNKVHLFRNVVQLLLRGTEGTVRQAAASALYNWFRCDCIRPPDKNLLYKIFVIASFELYWEVKLVAVNFWDQVFSEASGSTAPLDDWESFLRPLADIGFCDALVGLVEDEDFSVRNKVTDLVMRLVERLRPDEIVIDNVNQAAILGKSVEINSNLAVDQAPSSKLPLHDNDGQLGTTTTFSDAEKLSAIEATLNTTDMDVINVLESFADEVAACEPVKLETLAQELELVDGELGKCLLRAVVPGDDNLDQLTSSHRRCRRTVSPGQFVIWLRQLNLERLNEMTSQCTDLYESNCEALLDDMLVINYESDNEDDETAMDCY